MDSRVLTEPARIPEYENLEADSTTIARLRLLLEERFTLLRFAAYGLVLSTLLAFTIPFSYESRTQLMPPDTDSGSGLMSILAMTARTGGSLGMLAGDMLGLKTSGSLFVGILRSQTVEDRIIEQFNLKSVYRARLMLNARRRLESNTEITEDRKSGIIGIRVTDHDPQRAAAIAQAYVTELDRLVADLNTSAAHRERVFLEGRLKSVKQDLDVSAKEFSQFASKNTAIDIKEQGKAMVEAAAILQGQLIATQSELEGLRQIYADTNVRVHAARARIEELQKKLQEMGGGDLSGTAAVEGQTLYPSIRKLPLLGVTYAELYRNNRIQETVFDLLTQQCELAKVQEAKETPSVKVLDVAKPPEKKSFPPRLLIMFMGTFFAIMSGSVWLLAMSSWRSIDSGHPGKQLVMDTYATIKADLGLASGNGARFHQVRDKILWFKRNSSNPRT
ncbi:MAG TPA: lipopolysaccharide biosynthesis protein [Candidatus Sulfotelmatobacter sp.]|nr:lipopolysaccharide biosynthesis protein [Candidatus Sulfotelmatobacter sp.]